MIFYVNVDLGYEDNMFNMLGRRVDNFISLGYLRGYGPCIDSYCIEDLPIKIMWNTFFDFSFDFSMELVY